VATSPEDWEPDILDCLADSMVFFQVAFEEGDDGDCFSLLEDFFGACVFSAPMQVTDGVSRVLGSVLKYATQTLIRDALVPIACAVLTRVVRLDHVSGRFPVFMCLFSPPPD
jgi:hypothetical protein